MERPLTEGFVEGVVYSRREIRARLGGGLRASLPTVGGRVVCICVTREKNPGAPAEVLLGAAERAGRLARGLVAARQAVPLFVRRSPGAWEYSGEWRAATLIEHPPKVAAGAGASVPEEPALRLLLAAQRTAGAGVDGAATAGGG